MTCSTTTIQGKLAVFLICCLDLGLSRLSFPLIKLLGTTKINLRNGNLTLLGLRLQEMPKVPGGKVIFNLTWHLRTKEVIKLSEFVNRETASKNLHLGWRHDPSGRPTGGERGLI